MSRWAKTRINGVVKDANSGIYHLHAWVKGKTFTRSLKTKREDIARSKAEMMRAEISFEAAKPSEPDTFASALDHWLSAQRQRPSLKPRTVAYYEQTVARLLKDGPVKGEASLAKLTPVALSSWWSAYQAHPTHANNALMVLHGAFALAVERGLLRDDPSRLLERKRAVRRLLRLPSRAEFERVLADMRKIPRAAEAVNFVEFLAWSGVRIGEARAILWEDVGDETIHITGGEEGTKNSEERVIPIVAPLRSVIDRMKPDSEPGPLFHIREPRWALTEACKRAGVPHLRIHDLRHLFATSCLEAGVDAPTVALWLGHKDGGKLVMRTYGHIRNEHSLAQARKVL